MIKSMTWDQFGTLGRARSARTAFGTLAEPGGDCGVNVRWHAAQRVQPELRPMFTAAPQAYLKNIVATSVALHERSP